mmetsp:Transcript_10392/g.20200  ORF Transcript_10392/g.20200 Transcript_10392/m.20200 type:complete len:213 (-) Transcript_10392:762-1400(-)
MVMVACQCEIVMVAGVPLLAASPPALNSRTYDRSMYSAGHMCPSPSESIAATFDSAAACGSWWEATSTSGAAGWPSTYTLFTYASRSAVGSSPTASRCPGSANTPWCGTIMCANRLVGSTYLWWFGFTFLAHARYTSATVRPRPLRGCVSRAKRRIKRVSSSQSTYTLTSICCRSASSCSTISPSTSSTPRVPRGMHCGMLWFCTRALAANE